MRLWTSDGPWAGRRLAAVNYVLTSNGTPLPVGWDWAARSLDFAAPDPLVRPISRGVPVPIPTIADAEEQKQTLKKDSDATVTAKESQENVNKPAVARAPTLPEEPP